MQIDKRCFRYAWICRTFGRAGAEAGAEPSPGCGRFADDDAGRYDWREKTSFAPFSSATFLSWGLRYPLRSWAGFGGFHTFVEELKPDAAWLVSPVDSPYEYEAAIRVGHIRDIRLDD